MKRYTFSIPADDLLQVHFHALASSDSGNLSLEILDPSGDVLASVTATPSDSINRGLVTREMPLAAGTYTIEVRGVTDTDRGRFEFVVTRVLLTRIMIGDSITGHAIDFSGDSDSYSFVGQAGQEVNFFLQATNPSNTNTIVLSVMAPSAPRPITIVASSGGNPDLEGQASGIIVLPDSGTYGVTVAPEHYPGAYVGGYRFWIYPIDREPESHSAEIAVGDTVEGESIDHVGDIDEFSISVSQGQEINVFFQSLEGTDETLLDLAVLGVGGFGPNSTFSSPSDTILFNQATRIMRFTESGEYTIRVNGRSDRSASDRGAYRLFAYPINRRPEVAPSELVPGDSVLVELIDLPSDIDEYHVNITDDTLASFVIWHEGHPATDQIELLLVDPTSDLIQVLATDAVEEENQMASGEWRLEPGAYILRVVGGDFGAGAYRGRYRLQTFHLNEAPENVEPLVQVGDTIAGEVVDPLGDSDAFRFVGSQGEHVEVRLQGTGEPSGGGLSLSVLDLGTGARLASVGTELSSPSLDAHSTGRITLPANGDYSIRISGTNDGRVIGEQGPYRIALIAWATRTEHVSSSILVGDSVTGESIDFLADVDKYSLTGIPGQELSISYQRSDAASGVVLEVSDPATGDVIRSTSLYSTGRFFLPAVGQATIQVYEPRYCTRDSTCAADGAFSRVGSYEFQVHPINRAPEHVAAAVTMGDTIQGEAITPTGDVDEYTFDGTAGDTIRVYFHTPSGTWGGEGLRLELYESSSGRVLGTATAYGTVENLEDESTDLIPVESTATYGIRVRSVWDTAGTGEYRFLVDLVN